MIKKLVHVFEDGIVLRIVRIMDDIGVWLIEGCNVLFECLKFNKFFI
jgi:hypothetical protein